MTEERVYSVDEVAQKLNVASKTVEKYIREGKLKADRNPVSMAIVGIRESQYQEFLNIKPPDTTVQEVPSARETPNGSSDPVSESKKKAELAKYDAEMAEQENKRDKSKIEMELRKKGYDKLEQGLAEVQKRLDEADELLEAANKEHEKALVEYEALVKDREKINHESLVLREREKAIGLQLEEIVDYESKQDEFKKQYNGWRNNLQGMVDYHKQQIQPCVDVLKVVNKTINNWLEPLERSGIDYTKLTNFIFKKMGIIEGYIKVESKDIPDFDEKEEVVKLGSTVDSKVSKWSGDED